MLKFFRVISMVEGFSYIAILCVTLGFLSRDFVSYLGMFHGVLFMLYIAFSFVVSEQKGWSILMWIALCLASVIPFAFIFVELFLRKEAEIKESAAI